MMLAPGLSGKTELDRHVGLLTPEQGTIYVSVQSTTQAGCERGRTMHVDGKTGRSMQ
jgi:hypothetical protein